MLTSRMTIYVQHDQPLTEDQKTKLRVGVVKVAGRLHDPANGTHTYTGYVINESLEPTL